MFVPFARLYAAIACAKVVGVPFDATFVGDVATAVVSADVPPPRRPVAECAAESVEDEMSPPFCTIANGECEYVRCEVSIS
jgi:hypothetical protein